MCFLGCDICQCRVDENLCKPVSCPMQCLNGFKRDSAGCEVNDINKKISTSNADQNMQIIFIVVVLLLFCSCVNARTHPLPARKSAVVWDRVASTVTTASFKTRTAATPARVDLLRARSPVTSALTYPHSAVLCSAWSFASMASEGTRVDALCVSANKPHSVLPTYVREYDLSKLCKSLKIIFLLFCYELTMC